MKTISIGNGAMEASTLALGCMRIVRVPRQDADRLLHTALDLGINYFDHADVYGAGNSEKLFGELLDLHSSLRDKIMIQSKCTLVRDAVQTLYNDNSKQYILDSVDGILKRLNTDYLDSFLLHRYDTLMEPEEVAEAFDLLHRSGKVRHFGVSNYKPMTMQYLQKNINQKLIINQLQISVAHTDLIDAGDTMKMTDYATLDRNGDVLTYCRMNGITVQAWSPFQIGFYGGVYMGNENYPRLNAVTNRLAQEKGVSPSAIAIAWLLRHPAHIQPLIGTTNADRLKDIATGVGVELTRPEWYEMYRESLGDEKKEDLGNSNPKPAK